MRPWLIQRAATEARDGDGPGSSAPGRAGGTWGTGSNPSSGGANGVPYLPAFWRDLGPYLPPRNGNILLHHTIYFDGHGTSESLTNLLIYLVASATVLIVLDLRHAEATLPVDATEAAAMSVPIGAAP